MRYRHVASMVSLLVLCPVSRVHGQDLAALKASFTAEIDALNARNLNATLAPVADNMILFGIFSPFPIEGKEGYRQTVQEYFDNYEQAVLTPIEPEFRVVGTTGVAWGNFRLGTRQKGQSFGYADGRYMFTYAYVEGKWIIISMHYSLLQPLLR
jgi:ketosteroid isomerase-like protein